MFHHLAKLPSRFCQIHISPIRVGQSNTRNPIQQNPISAHLGHPVVISSIVQKNSQHSQVSHGGLSSKPSRVCHVQFDRKQASQALRSFQASSQPPSGKRNMFIVNGACVPCLCIANTIDGRTDDASCCIIRLNGALPPSCLSQDPFLPGCENEQKFA